MKLWKRHHHFTYGLHDHTVISGSQSESAASWKTAYGLKTQLWIRGFRGNCIEIPTRGPANTCCSTKSEITLESKAKTGTSRGPFISCTGSIHPIELYLILQDKYIWNRRATATVILKNGHSHRWVLPTKLREWSNGQRYREYILTTTINFWWWSFQTGFDCHMVASCLGIGHRRNWSNNAIYGMASKKVCLSSAGFG